MVILRISKQGLYGGGYFTIIQLTMRFSLPDTSGGTDACIGSNVLGMLRILTRDPLATGTACMGVDCTAWTDSADPRAHTASHLVSFLEDETRCYKCNSIQVVLGPQVNSIIPLASTVAFGFDDCAEKNYALWKHSYLNLYTS